MIITFVKIQAFSSQTRVSEVSCLEQAPALSSDPLLGSGEKYSLALLLGFLLEGEV